MSEAAPVRILYIDDDAGLRRLAVRTLARRGFVVTAAESGAEGVALAEAERFDLIAVDHYMPGMDGLETLKRLRQEGMSLVFISHKLYEVMEICDRITVLRDGKWVGTVEKTATTSKAPSSARANPSSPLSATVTA